MTEFFFDTETYPIRPGLLAPRLVCLQHAYNDHPPLIVLRDGSGPLSNGPYSASEHFLEALESDALMIAQNGAFDYAVLAAHDESLIQPVFRMFAQGRARDTMLAEQLIAIRQGLPLDRKGYFTLDATHQRYGGAPLDKGADSWRLRYALLEGVPVDEWPEAARKYAEEDVTSLRTVYRAQRRIYESPDEWFQCAAAFVLQLACCWGMRTDPVTLSWVETSLLTKREEAQRLLEEAGLLVDGSVKKAKVEEAIIRACQKLGKDVPRNEVTEKAAAKAKAKGVEAVGNIKADGETIEEIASADPVLLQKVEFEHAGKMLSTYLAPMKWGTHQAMNYRLNTLVATGRTSAGGSKIDISNPWWENPPEKPEVVTQGFNTQNPPKEAGIRDCVIPRDGHVFSSTDYSALESRVFAQCLLWIVGKSVLAEGYQKDPDFDPHTYFAAHLTGRTYEEGKRLHKSKDKDFAKERQVAKNINFSLPGGVGPTRFSEMAALAGIELTVDQCRYYIDEWRAAFPEVVSYFDYINWLTRNNKPLKQFVSGRIRGDVGYCDGCNSPFQGLGADISKYAFFLVSMECYAVPTSPLYGSRPLVLVHDEILAEHPKELASAATMRIKALMELAEQKMMPDIPPKAEPTLMTRWIKEAKAVYDAAGQVVVDPDCWDIGFDLKRPDWTRISLG